MIALTQTVHERSRPAGLVRLSRTPHQSPAVPMPVDRSNTVTKSLAHQRLTRHQRLGFSDERWHCYESRM